LPIWQQTATVIRDLPLTGTGLNTYGLVMAFYQTIPGEGHLSAAHNDYLQLAAEGGWLLGLPIVLAVVCFVREVRRRFEQEPHGSGYWIRVGACVGLIAIAVQSAADFSLQMPANAALFAVLAGMALHQAGASRE
jgi:O-antigen ligase